MLSKILSTPVDDMVDLVEKNPNCSVSFLQQSLKVTTEIIEKWIIVLEEFKILTVQYKGFEGFVDIHPQKKEKTSKRGKIDLDRLKDEFIERSKLKNYSFDKMKKLWPVFILEYKDEIKELFYEKAKIAGYDARKIEAAWKKYEVTLNEF
ncbi:MAG: hypothetical protein KC550_02125 [Nanoarchaeota archaeon]|nr:hypothetical protein [Nanoarchaeota archaeon]